jgi:branched-chain amino acid transport system ATP-binding protein
MLEVTDLTVNYGRITALRDVTINIDAGEFVAVVGPNGAGKSTLLLTIAGALQPTSGAITFDGEPLAGKQPENIIRSGLALVPEGRHIFGTLTVAENLLIGATPRRDGDQQVTADREEILELFPVLRERYHQRAGKLSGGEQQQLAIARALLSRPRLLLLDEPSLGLAPIIVDAVFSALETLREGGLTLLVVEQNAAVAVESADRAYVLRTGRVELSGTREELLAMGTLEGAVLGFTKAPPTA